MPVSTPGFKNIGSFHFLTLRTLSLGTQPPFCEEVQVHNREAHVERNQGAWPSAPTELPANFIQSHVSDSFWKPSSSLPIRPPQLILCGANMTLPHWPLQIWKLNKYKLFSKFLSLGVSFTTTDNQNQNQNWHWSYASYLESMYCSLIPRRLCSNSSCNFVYWIPFPGYYIYRVYYRACFSKDLNELIIILFENFIAIFEIITDLGKSITKVNMGIIIPGSMGVRGQRI